MARIKLKPLKEQVIVITGASSGIGLVTARMATKQGARLVVAARSEESLKRLVEEMSASGREAIYVTADVSRSEDVERIAQAAIERFGGFDTWVNNAAVSIYGKLVDVALEDMRRLFETNFWGLVYGALTAARHLKTKGGTIINVGSTLSERAIPLQGAYCASKHAVKAFTDSLRMELEAENAPVSVTLVKPGSVDTPYRHHAKNYLPSEPKNPGLVYSPNVVAEAILHCAVYPERDVFVGGGSKGIAFLGNYAPRLTDKIMEGVVIPGQQSDEPPRPLEAHGLYKASGELQERGGHPGHVANFSLYTKSRLHPLTTAAVLAGTGVALAAMWGGNGKRRRRRR